MRNCSPAQASTPSCPGNPARASCFGASARRVRRRACRRGRRTRSSPPSRSTPCRRWIAQGAEYKPHWAFIAPKDRFPRRSSRARRIVNDIDRFVLERLEREGLQLSPEADKETLINRVTLTLTGLPPTLAEVDAFVKDASRGAYEKVVDRLLASPGVRRAHGRVLAEHRPLLRERRLPRRLPRPAVLAVSRLGHRGVQQEHAVRPVLHLAARRRSAAGPHQGADARDGVPARGQAHDRERRDRRGVSRRVRGRSRQHRRHRFPRA